MYASGCTDGDTHGASAKASFVSILLRICERESSIDGGVERRKWFVVKHLIVGLLDYNIVVRHRSPRPVIE